MIAYKNYDEHRDIEKLIKIIEEIKLEMLKSLSKMMSSKRRKQRGRNRSWSKNGNKSKEEERNIVNEIIKENN